MNKRYLHHLWRKLKKINPWLISAVALLFLLIHFYALRQNNLTALSLRDEVYKADELGGDVETALKNLREYIYGHMNTDLSGNTGIYPPIQLKYRYERLVAAERDRVAEINGQLYTEAQADCERRFPQGLSGSGRIPCVQQYILDHGGVAEQPIPDSLYKFAFVSPAWSPDLAGWTKLVVIILSALLVLWLGLGFWLKEATK